MAEPGVPRDRALLLAGPALVTIILFMLLPMGIALVYSFMTPSPYGGVQHPFTAASYIRFLYDRDLDDALVFDTTYLQIFARSVIQSVLATLGCLIIGLPLAWYMATRSPRLREVLVLLVTIPFWTNLLIRTYCWVLLLRDQGLVNDVLLRLGLIQKPITFLYSDGAVLLGLIYSSLPFMVLPIYAALEKVDPRMVEAAYDLYANRFDIMRRLVWPLAKPGVAAGVLLVFVPALGSFLAPDILGGGKKLMIGTLIQQQFSTGRDWVVRRSPVDDPDGVRARLAAVGRSAPPQEWASPMRQRTFDWRRMPEIQWLSLLAFVFLYAPLVVLIVYSFNANRAALIWSGFSTQWFVRAVENPGPAPSRHQQHRGGAGGNAGLHPVRSAGCPRLRTRPQLPGPLGRREPHRDAADRPRDRDSHRDADLLQGHQSSRWPRQHHHCSRGLLHPVRGAADAGAIARHAARHRRCGARPLRGCLADVPTGDPAVDGTGHRGRRHLGFCCVARRFPDHADGGPGRRHDAAGLPLFHAAGGCDTGGQCGCHDPCLSFPSRP